jgi:hypothetical protein
MPASGRMFLLGRVRHGRGQRKPLSFGIMEFDLRRRRGRGR